ncbi:MAG: group I intron-associated PD-(D/E)XK endonuclease [Synechococcus sp.]|nr:group I intron-associated PD-(D/E)XK endonuclease [Synechococcus sp.]
MQGDGSLTGQIVGEIGVAIAVERLLRAGFLVAVPIVDDGYDLLAFSGRRYWRIQVKATASEGKNSTRIRIGCGKDKTKRYCPKHVDAIVAVHIRSRLCICASVASCGSAAWLNFSQHKDGDFSPLLRIQKHK